MLKNNVDFDIWKWTDLDPSTQTVRTRTYLPMAFELYGVALNTWFAAIEMKNGNAPQRVVVESHAALAEHAAFLRVRDGWHELRTNPSAGAPSGVETLREHLYTNEYCRLEAVATFADHNGECPVASVCIDEMGGTRTETGRQTLVMQPPAVGTLCTWNPDVNRDLPGESELRAAYGETVMVAFADALDRLGQTGTLRTPLAGRFPNQVSAAIFSVPLDRPMKAPRATAPGVAPMIAHCPLLTGCVLGPETSEAHWTFYGDTHTIQHMGSHLCLDVRNNAASANADLVLWPCTGAASQQWSRRASNNQQFNLVNDASRLCASVKSLPPRASGSIGQVAIDAARPLLLQPCTNGELQAFSFSDSRVQGPH